MERLPNEVLRMAFNFLSPWDLKNLRLTNRLFSNLCLDLLFSSEAHLFLTRASTERLVNLSYHPRIRRLVTSLLYETKPLPKFHNEWHWLNYVENDLVDSEKVAPRDPNRRISLRDQYESPAFEPGNSNTLENSNAAWPTYCEMYAWQEERNLDEAKNRDVRQALERLPNLKTIKIYIGPWSEYGLRSFATTGWTRRHPKPAYILRLPPPGFRNCLQNTLTCTSGDEGIGLLAHIKVMYLDNIALTAFSLQNNPLASQMHSSLEWLEELRITLDPAMEDVQLLQTPEGKMHIHRFICQAPNLRILDIGYTDMGPCELRWEGHDISCVLGQHLWHSLDTIMIRGWPIPAAYMLSFVSRHRKTLNNIIIDCATLIVTSEEPWPRFLKDLQRVKLWKNVELWGESEDYKGQALQNRYVLGWPAETAWVRNGTSLYYEYTNPPWYYEHTKEARRQIRRYAQHKIDTNPFAEGGIAHGCASWRNGEHVDGDFADLMSRH